MSEGEGSISISTSINTDVEVVSRTSTDELAENCLIWISNSKGLVRQYNGADEVPAKVALLSGHYVAEAWAGDSVSASFDKRWFKGRQEFDVTKGANTEVAIKCTVANVVASVNYAEGLEDVLSDFTMTVGHDRGSLTFTGRDDRKGYFMMPSTDKNLTYTLTGTQIDGSQFTHTGVIENAAPATEYALTVKYTPVTNEVGGAVFTIIVDRTEIKVTDERELIAAPGIVGHGFDLAETLMSARGSFTEHSVYVTSAIGISNLVLKSKAFESISVLGGDDFDILAMSQAGRDAVAAAGVEMVDQRADAEESLLKIIFSEEFLNNLEDGEYSIMFTATDTKGRSTTATLNIIVSDAPVMTVSIDEATIDLHSVILRGRTSKEVETAGFKYRAVGAADWQRVEAVAASRSIAPDTEFTAVVSGLEADTEYEYATVCSLASGVEFEGAVMNFTTADGPQLPNAGMETWGTIDKVTTLCTDESSMFWDSGNWGAKLGSIILGVLTQSTSSPVHSGQYAAQLTTKSMAGVIAAGNLFVGHFLATEGGTNGILGWGRPFTGEPKALKVWAKYTPGSSYSIGYYSGTEISSDGPDRGIIYIALLDDSKMEYNGYSWPVIVRTQDLTNYSFKKDAANVIAYGEHVFAEATPGSDLIEIEIPIEYYRQGVTPSNIIVTCAASQFGDYYAGAANSTLIVDDFKLIY